MKEKFICKSLSFIMKYQECDDLKIKKLKYGLEGIYSMIVKFLVVVFIAIFTSTIKETLLLILFYAGIRTFSFGWHAKTNIGCWITTLTIYNGLPFIIKYITIPNYISYTVLGIALLFMVLFAPADTPRRPLIRKKSRIKAKVTSVLVVILYTFIYLFTDICVIKNALIFALIMQIVFINPITYYLTNTQFNNYKVYKMKHE